MRCLTSLSILACLLSTTFPAWAFEKLQVVTTTAQIADMVEAIGGDTLQVTPLMGEAVDPHTYRQTRRDIAILRQADLVVANGLYLEAQLEPLLDAIATQQEIIALGDLLAEESYLSHPNYNGKFDPHIWMDLSLWSASAAALADEMASIWPEWASVFERGADALADELTELANYVETAIGSIPQEQRVLITAHDAFQYFSNAYDIQVEGIQGLSTESEAGLQRIEQLVAMLVERKIGAVFVESSVADRNVKALVEGAAARGHDVEIGGSLFSDAMGKPGTYEGTYIGMIDHNATTIARALGGSVPDRGWQGRLGEGS